METPEKPKNTSSLMVLGIILRAAFAVGVLVYVAFYTGDFSLFQKTVIVLIAFIIYQAVKAIVHVTRPGRRGIKYGWW